MAAFNYARMAATATRLLTRFGGPLQLVRVLPGAYDPATDTLSGGSETSHTVTGAKFDYEQDDIDGTVIRKGDQRAYIAPTAAVTPQTGDVLTIDGEQWNVVASRPLKPASVIVLHDVQVRR